MHVIPQSVSFTAGDLIEGLAFMEVPERRAVLFGLEQGMSSAERVVNLTYRQLPSMMLTDISGEIIRQQPRHARLSYVFWHDLGGGIIGPLAGLERVVQQSFGCMSWADLQRAYHGMVWIDEEIEVEHFRYMAQKHGLI